MLIEVHKEIHQLQLFSSCKTEKNRINSFNQLTPNSDHSKKLISMENEIQKTNLTLCLKHS
jgi:hypothetical protein